MVLLFFETDCIDEALLRQFLPKLPLFRQERIKAYHQHEDKVRSFAAYALLCLGLGKCPDTFLYNEYGKPFLKNGEYEISLTHSKICAGAAFDKSPIGLDAEYIRKDYPKNLIERVFTPFEQKQINESKNSVSTFFRLWTLKESYIKFQGKGIQFPLQEVEFDINEESPLCSDKGVFFKEFSQNGHQIAVCSLHAQEIRIISLVEFRNFFRTFANV